MKVKQKKTTTRFVKKEKDSIEKTGLKSDKNVSTVQAMHFPSLLFVALYDTEQIWAKILTARQLPCSELDKYDLCFAECLSVMQNRDCKGKLQPCDNQGKLIQSDAMAVWATLAFNPGIYLNNIAGW